MPRLTSRTLRALPPTTRKLARLNNELASAHRRIANLLPQVEAAEIDALALAKFMAETPGAADGKEERA